MSEKARKTSSGAQRFAQRGAAISAAAGIALSLVVAALVMKAALMDGARRLRDDLGALLMSSCQAAVALDDEALVQETLDELAPRLPDLVYVGVHSRAGKMLGRWGHEPHDATMLAGSTPVLGSGGAIVGQVELVVSTQRADEALRRMWLYLGLIGVVSLALSTSASVLLGRAMAEKSRLEGEIDVAERVQTAVLPKNVALPGFDVAARMVPASEVGGDYYDFIPCDDGGFVCIGDVVGHGLPAGLVMLMMQSGLSALLRGNGSNAVGAVQVVNSVLYENTARMGSPRHATLSVLRCANDGMVECAGGHLDPLVIRSGGAVEMIDAPGPFVGLEPELDADAIGSTRFSLDAGDVLLLYSDGVTEARGANGDMFGPERLKAVLERARGSSAAAIVDRVLQAARDWAPEPQDDMTVVAVLRRAEA